MGIQLTAVACNNCGGPLSVQEATRFVTCSHCGSQLAVHRTDGAMFTQVLEALESKTNQIADEVDQLRAQTRIDALERQWQERRAAYTAKLPTGESIEPSAGAGVAIAIASAIVSIVAGLAVGATLDRDMGLVVAVVGSMVGLLTGVQIMYKTSQYEDAEQDFLQQCDTFRRGPKT